MYYELVLCGAVSFSTFYPGFCFGVYIVSLIDRTPLNFVFKLTMLKLRHLGIFYNNYPRSQLVLKKKVRK